MLISTKIGSEGLSAEGAVTALRAAGEPTRLRILALLAHGELAVGELAAVLGQSQPRVSRHLRLLTEAGLIARAPEGAWVFYRLETAGPARLLLDLCAVDDPDLREDERRLEEVRAARDEAAAAYFEANAADWDRIRNLHLPDADIETAVLEAAGGGPFDLMVDAGVGAGRMIEVFADRVRRAEGFDTSRQMLALARAALDDLPQANAAVRYGDIYNPPLQREAADLVTIHHVLHFLADPKRAIREAARLLRPGGRLVIVDFASHGLEFLRERYAHRRLGFTDADIAAWCAEAGIADVTAKTLAPDDKDKLTVKIWAGDRAGPVHAIERATEKAA